MSPIPYSQYGRLKPLGKFPFPLRIPSLRRLMWTCASYLGLFSITAPTKRGRGRVRKGVLCSHLKYIHSAFQRNWSLSCRKLCQALCCRSRIWFWFYTFLGVSIVSVSMSQYIIIFSECRTMTDCNCGISVWHICTTCSTFSHGSKNFLMTLKYENTKNYALRIHFLNFSMAHR